MNLHELHELADGYRRRIAEYEAGDREDRLSRELADWSDEFPPETFLALLDALEARDRRISAADELLMEAAALTQDFFNGLIDEGAVASFESRLSAWFENAAERE